MEIYRHQVRWDWATNEKMQFVWKTNLLGGGRLFHLIYRLSLLRTFREFINEKEKVNPEWIYEVGYEAGNTRNKEIISYLHKQDKVTSIDKNGKIYSEAIEESKYFYRPKEPKLFSLPLLIIHKRIGTGFLPIGIRREYNREFLIFNSSFLGIHAPKSDFEGLESIFNYLKKQKDLVQLWISSNSPSAMVNQETSIKKSDLESLPFPHEKKYINFSKAEKIIQDDVLKYYRHLGKGISKRSSGIVLNEASEQIDLRTFGETYCENLNEIYATKDQSWQIGQVIQTPLFTRYQFGFGKNDGLKYSFSEESEEEIFNSLNDNLSNKGAIHKRIIRYYKHENGYDCVYLIKPNARRYWLKSIALRDADET